MTGTPHRTLLRRPRIVALAALVVLAGVIILIVVNRPGSGTPTSGGTTTAPTKTGKPSASSTPFVLPTDTTTDVARLPQPAQAALVPATDGVAPLPHAVGFGQDATGGAGGEIYHVTSAADSEISPAPGTLRYGLLQQKPLWIVFDSDLTIHFTAVMTVAPDKTIDGRGHAVTLTGHGVAGLHLYDTHNVIVENLTFRDFGDTAQTKNNDPSDEIDMQRSSDIWIDHCTMSMAGDKLISTEAGATRITVSWNKFYDQEQGLQFGTISTAPADIQTLVTVHHNFFDRLGYREPLVAYAKVHVYNNYMFEWRDSAVRSERLAQIYLQANVFAPVKSVKAALVRPASRCNDSHKFCDGRSGYLYSINNDVVNHASIRDTGPAHVFNPGAAYAYTAEKAGPALVAAITSGAGAH